MRLLTVELDRFRSRRAVAVVLVVAAALAAFLVVSTAWSTRPVSATDRAEAEQLAAVQTQEMSGQLARCERNPDRFLGTGATAAECAQLAPQADWFLPRSDLDLRSELEARGSLLVVLLAGVAILVGASFCGADWASGSMSNQLLFEPRRLKVWAAKGLAVAIGATLVAGVVLAGFWASMYAVARSRGLATAPETVTAILQTSGRGLVLVAAAALGGFALTMLLRHTVGTLGLLFAYAVVGEGLAAALPFDRMSQWSLAQNVLAWVQDGVEVYDESICAPGVSCDPFYTLGLPHAAAYLGVLLVLAVVVSALAFRRRDVP